MENTGVMEVYHFTSAESLRRILDADAIEIGASTHDLNGKKIHGVSTTRNGFFNITNTYAIAGKKPWRIGLDYKKLRQNLRVIPIRDEYLRSKSRGVRGLQRVDPFSNYKARISHDEMEEFVLGDIVPLARYITSIAVDDNAVDFSLHPKEYASDEEYYLEDMEIEGADQFLLFDLLASTHEELFSKVAGHPRHGTYSPHYVPIEDDVPFFFLDRSSHRLIPVEQRFSQLLADEHF